MSKILCYQTLSEEQSNKEEKQKTPLDNKYYVEWGVGNSYVLVCDDEDTRRTYERHSDTIIGVYPLQKTRNTFITIGLDNKIQVGSVTGRNLCYLQGHTDRILGVVELDKNRILSASTDGTLRLWNTKNGKEIESMPVDIDSFDAISFFSDRKHFSVNETDRVSIWSVQATKTLELEGLKDKVNSANRLANGNWLVSYRNENDYQDRKYPSIWSNTGKPLHTFEFDFCVFNDVYQIEQDQILVKKNNDCISLRNSEGQEIACHVFDKGVVDIFSSLRNGLYEANNHIEAYPGILDYEHIRNPIGRNHSFVPRHELEEQDIDLSNPERKRFWDFFNRPLFAPIKTALKNPIRVARSGIAQVETLIEINEQELEHHIKKRKSGASWGKLWLLLGFVSGAGAGTIFAAFFLREPAFVNFAQLINLEGLLQSLKVEEVLLSSGGVFVLCLFGALACFNSSLKNKSLQKQKEANLKVLSRLIPAFESLIGYIKEYRNSLLKSTPGFSNPQVYSGIEVSEGIKSIVNGSLEQTALDECGLEQEDIIASDKKAIILKDWALLQNLEGKAHIRSKMNFGNANSFWSANGEMLFAVQYIQYIFLTEDKIDVFTAYYDFVNNKVIGKEANAFYYKDVTNFTKREVERYYGEEGLSAVEITLAVASGEKIQLTIQSDESAAALVDTARNNEDLSIAEKRDKLLREREQYEENESLSDQERAEELKAIDNEIHFLENSGVEQNIAQNTNKADAAIRNIRAQLRVHKKQDDLTGNQTELVSRSPSLNEETRDETIYQL
ncbi:hypothetical protein [Vibrio sp. 1CM24A]|uniref:WD40 repeat domain-containing protein n=1 Tax=Vibrio sp. 1CM24A TaxID=2929165 RepID=UPI0020C10990|nr:hypothetical protein [Vibrio sp. 1CM24A]MCK8080663.1 hypothetical protein [Vibrio sp. 1CM24A]